jgi:hypothetical protein
MRMTTMSFPGAGSLRVDMMMLDSLDPVAARRGQLHQ